MERICDQHIVGGIGEVEGGVASASSKTNTGTEEDHDKSRLRLAYVECSRGR